VNVDREELLKALLPRLAKREPFPRLTGNPASPFPRLRGLLELFRAGESPEDEAEEESKQSEVSDDRRYGQLYGHIGRHDDDPGTVV